MTWTQTYKGLKFFPLDPKPEDVCIEDIAHHLAIKCRFGGATQVPYSVAEHSVRVSECLVPLGHRLQLVGLLHDAAEAYLPDWPAPIKSRCGVIIEKRGVMSDSIEQIYISASHLEYNILDAIGRGLGVLDLARGVGDDAIKSADLILRATEKRDLMAKPPDDWGPLPNPMDEKIMPWEWFDAKRRFLKRWAELIAQTAESR